MGRRRACEVNLTFKERLKLLIIKILKWSVIIALSIAVSVVQDIVWHSDMNPLHKGSYHHSIMDHVIKAAIVIGVFWYIVPTFASVSVIFVYSILLSWLALAQNLPSLDLKNDITKVWMEHFKCGLHLFIKFLLLRVIQRLRAKLKV